MSDHTAQGTEGTRFAMGSTEAPPEDWDAFVTASPDSTFCHLGGWKYLLDELMGHQCYYVVARDPGGGLLAALPLVRVKSLLFGDYLVSMPFLNYGGPIGDAEALAPLAAEARRLGEAIGTGLLELRTRYEIPGTDLERSARKVTVILPLPDSPESLWKDVFYSKLRTKLRRAEKEGFEVRIGHDVVDDFFDVFAHNMRDLGTPVLPPEFFRRLPGVFGERVIMAGTYLDGIPVAGACGFLHGNEFELTWSSALREYNRFNPNMYMYWKLMAKVIDSGGETFNFGRSTPGSGTHRFKLSWGGHDEPLPWLVHAYGRSTKPPTPDDKKFSLAIRAWQRLPVGVSRVLGPYLSPYLP